MSPQHVLFVFDENDAIIERFHIANGWQQARKLTKELKRKYKGRNVTIKDGYLGVSEELFNSTKALLERISEKYPNMAKVYVKDHPEFKHLGYDINN